MKWFGRLLAAVLILLVCMVGYLRLFHRFVFEDLAMLPAMLLLDDVAKADPTIDTLAELDALIVAQVAEYDVPGMAVAIVANGDVAWSKGYGFANIEDGVAVTADTPFKVASVSKAVLGTTIMKAAENGLVDLDADINDYLDFTVDNPLLEGEKMTLRHLATHTSGIVDREWVYANSYQMGDAAESLDSFLEGYLLPDGKDYAKGNFAAASPGELYEYSNIATGLAGHVVGEAAGMRLDQYAQQHLFEPLQMHNSAWFMADFADPNVVARPYVRRNRPFPHYSYPTYPEGMLRTSANDLARLLAMVMNRGELDGVRVLEAETIETMLAQQPFSGLADVSGEGIFWSYTRSGLLGHTGGDHGATTFMMFNPDTEIGVVVLTNLSPSGAVLPASNIARQILQGTGSPQLVE